MNGNRLSLFGRWWDTRVFHNREHFYDWKRYGRNDKIVVPKLYIPETPNGITNVGIHYLLDAGFNTGAQSDPWYAGLIDNAGYTGLASGDTMASHSGWTEISTQYDEANRQTLAFPAASGRAITAEVSFTFNDTKTVKGLLVASNNTKGGTSGTLFSTALYSSAPAMENGNVLTSNYTLSD